jgi:hypothetical protein
MAMEAILARRFSPLNFSAIAGYPHPVPQIDEWQDLLPRFYEGENDNPVEHVQEFHALMQQLDIQHEDIHMKLFMYSLQGDVRIWYQSLETSSISSLKEFHAAFNIHCQKFYSSELICHSCCEEYKDCVQDIIDSHEGCEDEEDALDEESTLSLPCSSTSDENFVCCSYEENAEDIFVLETDVFSSPTYDEEVVSNTDQEQPIFDEYSDEEEQIPTSHFVDLRSNQPVYDNYESDFDEDMKEFQDHTIDPFSSFIKEQHCEEINHPGSADNIKQPMTSSEISLQPCSDLQIDESGSLHGKENMPRIFDLQLEQYQAEVTFYCHNFTSSSFHDPVAIYMEEFMDSRFQSSFHDKSENQTYNQVLIFVLVFILLKHIQRVWLVNQFLVWLHWKHDFT